MPTKQKSIEKVAEEALQQEETANRGRRLEELKAGEQKRRENEARLAELEKIQAEAAVNAEKLAEERLRIEEAAQARLSELRDELASLRELDGRHARENMRARRAQDEIERAHSGKDVAIPVEDIRSNRGGMVQTGFTKTVAGWITESLPEFFDPRSAGNRRSPGTLAERDTMTTGAQRKLGPGAKPIVQPLREPTPEEKRLNNGYQHLLAIYQRRELMDYGRPISWEELVPAEERERLSEVLSEEEVAEMWASIEEHGGGGGCIAIE